MLKLLSGTDLNKFKPRDYIVADTDTMSIQKAKSFEEKTNTENSDYKINTIVRSRKVGQSYLTSIWTTLMDLS